MDGTQCAHVFEITQPECLVCAGRNRSCEKFVERRMSDEKENESCDRDRPDAGQCGATDGLVRADRPTRAVGAGACAAGSDHPAARAAGQRESGRGDGAGSQRDAPDRKGPAASGRGAAGGRAGGVPGPGAAHSAHPAGAAAQNGGRPGSHDGVAVDGAGLCAGAGLRGGATESAVPGNAAQL